MGGSSLPHQVHAQVSTGSLNRTMEGEGEVEGYGSSFLCTHRAPKRATLKLGKIEENVHSERANWLSFIMLLMSRFRKLFLHIKYGG